MVEAEGSDGQITCGACHGQLVEVSLEEAHPYVWDAADSSAGLGDECWGRVQADEADRTESLRENLAARSAATTDIHDETEVLGMPVVHLHQLDHDVGYRPTCGLGPHQRA